MTTPYSINIKDELYHLDEPKVMGIVNLTPDSFYEGSRTSADLVLRTAEKMISEGADFLDLGGYSSRPGADHVSQEEEIQRVIPAISAISQEFPSAIISVDTFRSKVAHEAVNAGANMINDISAGEMDEDMFSTVAELQVPYIFMHMQGTPADMQLNPTYKNVVQEVFYHLSQKLEQLHLLGVNDVIADVGFGFGKTVEHNYDLLHHIENFHELGCPILAGLSRKSMIYKPLETTPEDALTGSIVLNLLAVQKGAHILRVHDVKETKQMLKLHSLTNLN